jgi:uncharacterized protein YjbJ (UPF0337 family)/uncharacterized membrane protein YtjA (UPF0391 family)
MLRKTARTLALVPILTLGLAGCSDTSGVKEETKITTPGGTTKITDETKVQKTGENPPPAKPWSGVASSNRQGRDILKSSAFFGARSSSMANAQQLQGTWNKVRGQVKEKWGNLTDDDLQLHGGNIDQVVGKIQQKTGETREAIEKFLNELTERGSSAVSQVAQTIGQTAQDAGYRLREEYRQVAGQVSEGLDRAQHVVVENPARSVAAAFGVGLAFGLLVGLALRSRWSLTCPQGGGLTFGGGVSGVSADIAKVFALVFLVLAVISMALIARLG